MTLEILYINEKELHAKQLGGNLSAFSPSKRKLKFIKQQVSVEYISIIIYN